MLKDIPKIHAITLFYRMERKKGLVMEVNDRRDSSVLFCLSGKLKFVTEKETVYADKSHPVYVPAGSSHKHYCEIDADCILFNFEEQCPGDQICNTAPINEKDLLSAYAEITACYALPSLSSQAKAFSVLYHLFSLCTRTEQLGQNKMLSPALQYISLEFQNADLDLQQIADRCHISKIYLHKLFVQELGITPFRYITRLRMERAKILLGEKYPPKQVSKLVGYGDMYAFSRAYKRHFGVPPRKHYAK
ncbi:MAG: helix-turn-helix transcriptional regulator [Clostridia bacterium]|nr:helix-turn-helix transcriptional regulator [Clostridia bacterium]